MILIMVTTMLGPLSWSNLIVTQYRENQRLKSVIASAVNILDDSINNVETRTGSQLREECGDCVGAVGQAIWDCGTLDIDCIK